MSRVKYIILSMLLFILIAIIQINVIGKIQLFGVSANIFVIYLVYINILSEDEISNIILSVITGFLFDIFTAPIIGIYGIIGMTIAIATPIFCKRISVEARMGTMLYTFIVTFCVETFYGIVYLLLRNATIYLFEFVINVLIASVLNMIIVMLIHGIFTKSIKEKNESNKIIRRY